MDSDINHIGQRIRRLRRDSKMTLLEVATASSLSVGFLSQVERNLTGISISSLVNVAKALGVPLGALLEQPRQAQPDSHEGRRESYRVGPMRQRYERLSTTFDGSQLNAVKVQMLQGYSSEWVAHGGDEFVYVLAGQVRYTLRKKDYLLSAGDSLHFDAHERHRVVNVGQGAAEMIVVGTLPFFDDDQSEPAPGDGERSAPRTNAAKKKAATPRAASAKVAQDKQFAAKAEPRAKAKALSPKQTTKSVTKKR
ncbi:cupin domain-containing protein [Trinickia sp. Y13]|uniref:helix-turn-helix domain-containing protein n=1 Tax=Trinickia sp. Y13 TaxID=2917807 RepID=UPI002406D072|nr:cupin domain-containing protein [Trinickia sp. Y13]MDG0025625.1 cupin domain-containing protein [Trinickia sp. Y13]